MHYMHQFQTMEPYRIKNNRIELVHTPKFISYLVAANGGLPGENVFTGLLSSFPPISERVKGPLYQHTFHIAP